MSHKKQAALVGAISAGMRMGIPMASMLRAIAGASARPPRQLTEKDTAHINAAEAKRQRKAAAKAQRN